MCGINVKIVNLVFFICDLWDSRFTLGDLLCVSGYYMYVLISWICQKQIEVSHNSVESEIIVLDADLCKDDSSALQFWTYVSITLSLKKIRGNHERQERDRIIPSHSYCDTCVLASIDNISCDISNSSHTIQLHIFEVNTTVIQTIKKKRSPPRFWRVVLLLQHFAEYLSYHPSRHFIVCLHVFDSNSVVDTCFTFIETISDSLYFFLREIWYFISHVFIKAFFSEFLLVLPYFENFNFFSKVIFSI